MDKKEKYYQYIVDDMIKNTVFNEYTDLGPQVLFPWLKSVRGTLGTENLSSMTVDFYNFNKLLMEKYGVREEDFKIVMSKYIEAVNPLIDEMNKKFWRLLSDEKSENQINYIVSNLSKKTIIRDSGENTSIYIGSRYLMPLQILDVMIREKGYVPSPFRKIVKNLYSDTDELMEDIFERWAERVKIKSLSSNSDFLRDLRDINENKINKIDMKRILSESGFARVNRILQGDVSNINTYAILTGENPCGCELSKSENREMNSRMESMLRSKGYGFHKIGGNFFNNEENSVMVPNMTREDAIELGERLKQYSVIFGSKNVTGGGRVFMKHQMLRTYCDGGCKKFSNWDNLSLNQKLRGLKPLSKKEVGYVESERNVSITDKDIQSKITNYSYVDDDRRRFSIPFYDDPKASAYPSQEYGKNIVPYQYDMTKQRDLSTKEKFGFLDYNMNENYKSMKKVIKLTENDLTRIVKKVIKEQQDFPLERAFNKVIEVLEKGDYKVFISLVLQLNNEELSEKIFEYLGAEPIPLPQHGDAEGRLGYQKYLFSKIIYVLDADFFKI